jgi:hypothetical protein
MKPSAGKWNARTAALFDRGPDRLAGLAAGMAAKSKGMIKFEVFLRRPDMGTTPRRAGTPPAR